MNDELFPDLERITPPPKTHAGAAPRVARANRRQTELRPTDLESLLPEDHRARIVWSFVEQLDLTPLYAEVRAVAGGAGRPAIDPMILMALWLYATLDGVGSARQVARLCRESDPYRWICGGVGVNHHALSDFRVGHEAFLDGVLTKSVASLLAVGAVTLKRVSQDGMRVRASAGTGSFRRKKILKRCLADAQAQVKALKRKLEDGVQGASKSRVEAARLRAAKERAKRVKAALEEMPQIEEVKERNRKKAPGRHTSKDGGPSGDEAGSDDDKKTAARASTTEPDARVRHTSKDGGPSGDEAGSDDDKKTAARASTTDPDARVMKMADNGFRPAYNVQYATDTESLVVVGVDVTNEGSDAKQMIPMLKQLKKRYGRLPDEYLVDGGFATVQAMAQVPDGCTVYGPVPPRKNKNRNPYLPLPNDPEKVAKWRVRMGTTKAKEIYKQRAASAEYTNAQIRNRQLQQLRVRGRAKARCVALWHALAQNFTRLPALTPT